MSYLTDTSNCSPQALDQSQACSENISRLSLSSRTKARRQWRPNRRIGLHLIVREGWQQLQCTQANQPRCTSRSGTLVSNCRKKSSWSYTRPKTRSSMFRADTMFLDTEPSTHKGQGFKRNWTHTKSAWWTLGDAPSGLHRSYLNAADEAVFFPPHIFLSTVLKIRQGHFWESTKTAGGR